MAAMAGSDPTAADTGSSEQREPRHGQPTIDLDRLEAILERQVEEVAYETALTALDGVLPESLRRFIPVTAPSDRPPPLTLRKTT